MSPLLGRVASVVSVLALCAWLFLGALWLRTSAWAQTTTTAESTTTTTVAPTTTTSTVGPTTTTGPTVVELGGEEGGVFWLLAAGVAMVFGVAFYRLLRGRDLSQ